MKNYLINLFICIVLMALLIIITPFFLILSLVGYVTKSFLK